MKVLDSPHPMDWPTRHISLVEVKEEVSKRNVNKSPCHDCLTGITIKSLPPKGFRVLTLLFNSMLRPSHSPNQWKSAEIIIVGKHNKPENVLKSYRSISLLIAFSKIFEKIYIRKLLLVLWQKLIIPNHQFGFKTKHGTIEQWHAVASYIIEAIESKNYGGVVLLAVEKAFGKV